MNARATFVAVTAFFGLKIFSGLLLVKLSAHFLSIDGFSIFSQLLMLAALLNLVAIGGAQTGIVRQSAAARSDDDLERVQRSAIAIWLLALVVIGGGLLFAREQASLLLAGRRDEGSAIAWIVVLTLSSGPGQIACSIMTGRHRAIASLAAQGLGLLAGTGACIWQLARGEPSAAAIAFAAGPVITMAVALASLRPSFAMGRHISIDREIRTLLGYSSSLVIVTAVITLALFGMRAAYRNQFGIELLGYWLVANRISDTTTQILALLAGQIFLPKLTYAREIVKQRRIIVACWALGVAIMLTFLGAFAAAPSLLVTHLLSPQYLPAIGGIMAYMAGDILRVWAVIAINVAAAHNRIGRLIAVDCAAIAIFAVVTLMLIRANMKGAPFIGYAAGYGLVAAVTSIIFIAGRRRGSSMPTHND